MVWKGFEFGPAPEGYEGNKDKDPVGYFQNKEHEVREKYVEMAQSKLLRERLRECYWTQEVNHMKNCKESAGVYRANNGRFE